MKIADLFPGTILLFIYFLSFFFYSFLFVNVIGKNFKGWEINPEELSPRKTYSKNWNIHIQQILILVDPLSPRDNKNESKLEILVYNILFLFFLFILELSEEIQSMSIRFELLFFTAGNIDSLLSQRYTGYRVLDNQGHRKD